MSLIKSKQRVADHGEVFTPPWMVEAMLDLVKDETERIDSRFLEPACGSGNFLVRVLQRKLAAVELKFGKSDFEKRHYALLALMCIYGIELLADNIAECRANMLEILAEYLNLDESDDLYRAASYVLSQNLVHGDALTMRTHDGQPITFAEWGYLGKGKFQRRDFRFDVLTQLVGFQRGGLALRPPGQARDLHADQDLPADDGERTGRRRARTHAEGGRMSTQASFALRGRNPDVLTCIANLSNDEVFTPPEFANRMLDTLAEAWAADHNGANLWADKTVRFLDPCTKSGVFLREITSRLTKGLADEIPNLEERVDHILTKQVFGIGITYLTSLLARRSVYCSKHAKGKHSIAKGFASDDGNIWFERMEHTWVDGKCTYCGASQKTFDRGEGLETHAYAFIHTDDIKTRLAELFGGDMQFDVIIGNPPYQLDDGGYGTSAAPIYQLFVEQAKELDPRYPVDGYAVALVGGWARARRVPRGDARRQAPARHSSTIPDSSRRLPGVEIRGGICYFLWDRDHATGTCEVTTISGGEASSAADRRYLDELRHSSSATTKRCRSWRRCSAVESGASTARPSRVDTSQFGSASNFETFEATRRQRWQDRSSDALSLPERWHGIHRRRTQSRRTPIWIDKWKVFMPGGSGTAGRATQQGLDQQPLVARQPGHRRALRPTSSVGPFRH